MKNSFFVLIFIIIANHINYSQNIKFIPSTETVKVISGCTPPEAIFKLFPGMDCDTIKVIAGFNSFIDCSNNSGDQINISSTVGFICSQKGPNDFYELYYHQEPTAQNIPQMIPFDSLFSKGFFLNFLIKLKLKRNGIYTDSLTQKFYAYQMGLAVENEPYIIPNDCKIISIYPNPFNPSTKIKYQISRTNFVNISVYNSLGELVEVIEHEVKNPDKYEAVWNAKHEASGVYFIVLSTADYLTARKIILLK